MNINKMNQVIEFQEKQRINDKGISKEVYKTVFKAYAHIDTVWAKDYQTAVSSGTQNRLKFTIRFIPVEITNKMHIHFKNQTYDIKEVYPDFTNHEVITIMAERVGL
ncbi:phage head closure protein [Salinicoccus halitifaciens]|uniref:SPP1 family predicted phage head-tail adaptor n=1 Tax=Salinicoccus halitifaciens TaxID=1073415 RepID=A0ABV2E5S1_9STAP|nr:phage head closure protein [Salinicoccus halitifaciens]MCD2137172.1 phage head closure protein [Salinicoccus halitifaciens]